jgi:DNA-binding MarR family transcriptional regulator
MIKSSQTIAKPDVPGDPLMAAFRRFRAQVFGGSMNLETFIRNNLTIAQLRAIYALGQHGRLSGRQLARQLHVSPAAVVPLCDRLERDGYVNRIPDTVDRRVTWIELSPSGRSTLENVAWVGPDRMRKALKRLSDGDRKALVRILEQLAEELETSD